MSIRDALDESNPEALLAVGYEEALIGIAKRCGQPDLAVYDYNKGVRILMERDGMTWEEAVEFIDYNTVGAWFGPNTPIWLVRPDDG